MHKGISVVICCYNGEQKIQKVLSCLQNQNISTKIDWEVLLVDNASTDDTANVARSCWKLKDVELRIVLESNPGISFARKRGFEDAAYEIISFVDDDNWVEEDWIQKVFTTMYDDPEIGILGGMGNAAFEGTSPFWFSRYQDSYAVGPQSKQSGEIYTRLYGAGMNIRKSTWEDLQEKGFEFQLTGRKGKNLSSGEDSELSQAVRMSGKKLYYRSDLTFSHLMPAGRLSWDYLIKLSASFGRSEPILGIYRSLLRGDKGFNARKYQDRLTILLRFFYENVKFIPKRLRLIFVRKEGKVDHVRSVYLWNSFRETLVLYAQLPAIVSEIRNGKWNRLEK